MTGFGWRSRATGPDRERLEALAKETGAPTVFLGRISEIEKAALFAEATLFAMPTRAEGDSVEGFGIVYLEAAWHGAPALAGREGGAAAAVKEGETGWALRRRHPPRLSNRRSRRSWPIRWSCIAAASWPRPMRADQLWAEPDQRFSGGLSYGESA